MQLLAKGGEGSGDCSGCPCRLRAATFHSSSTHTPGPIDTPSGKSPVQAARPQRAAGAAEGKEGLQLMSVQITSSRLITFPLLPGSRNMHGGDCQPVDSCSAAAGLKEIISAPCPKNPLLHIPNPAPPLPPPQPPFLSSSYPPPSHPPTLQSPFVAFKEYIYLPVTLKCAQEFVLVTEPFAQYIFHRLSAIHASMVM